MRGRFWNLLGLPSTTDIQELKQVQEERFLAIETANQRLLELLEQTNGLIDKLALNIDVINKENKEHRQVCTSNLLQVLDTKLKSASAERENLISLNNATYQLINQSAQSQDELLRILIVNLLRDEIDTALKQDK